MRVSIVPVLEDNYSYLLICEATKKAAAVDPAQPAKVLAQAERDGVDIVAILTTHRHLYCFPSLLPRRISPFLWFTVTTLVETLSLPALGQA